MSYTKNETALLNLISNINNQFSYIGEDEAVDRSGYNYDPDEEWAVETYENGLVVENCHWAETTCEDEEEEDD